MGTTTQRNNIGNTGRAIARRRVSRTAILALATFITITLSLRAAPHALAYITTPAPAETQPAPPATQPVAEIAPHHSFSLPGKFDLLALTPDGKRGVYATTRFESPIFPVALHHWPEALGVLAIFLWLARFRRVWRRDREKARWNFSADREPHCAACGYQLTGITSPSCPECGGSLAGKGTRIGPRPSAMAVLLFAWRSALFAAIVLAAIGTRWYWPYSEPRPGWATIKQWLPATAMSANRLAYVGGADYRMIYEFALVDLDTGDVLRRFGSLGVPLSTWPPPRLYAANDAQRVVIVDPIAVQARVYSTADGALLATWTPPPKWKEPYEKPDESLLTLPFDPGAFAFFKAFRIAPETRPSTPQFHTGVWYEVSDVMTGTRTRIDFIHPESVAKEPGASSVIGRTGRATGVWLDVDYGYLGWFRGFETPEVEGRPRSRPYFGGSLRQPPVLSPPWALVSAWYDVPDGVRLSVGRENSRAGVELLDAPRHALGDFSPHTTWDAHDRAVFVWDTISPTSKFLPTTSLNPGGLTASILVFDLDAWTWRPLMFQPTAAGFTPGPTLTPLNTNWYAGAPIPDWPRSQSDILILRRVAIFGPPPNPDPGMTLRVSADGRRLISSILAQRDQEVATTNLVTLVNVFDLTSVPLHADKITPATQPAATRPAATHPAEELCTPPDR